MAAPVLWTVDHGPGDITRLMRATLTAPLARTYADTLTRMVHSTTATPPALD